MAKYAGVLFVIPVMINAQQTQINVQIWGIYTLSQEIHDNVDMVMEIKNVYEMEGVISTWKSYVHFSNRSIPFSLGHRCFWCLGQQMFIKINMPFIDEISGPAMIKLLEIYWIL